MSKFIDKIQLEYSNNRKIQDHWFDVEGIYIGEKSSQDFVQLNYQKEYKFIFAIIQKGWIHQHAIEGGETLEGLRNIFIDTIKKEIYQDIRKIAIKMLRAYHERNKYKLEELIKQLFEEVK